MIGPACQDYTKDRSRRSGRIVKHFIINPFREKDKAFFLKGSEARRVAKVSKARAVFCYLSVRRLGESCVSITKLLGLTQSAVSKAVVRGKTLSSDKKIERMLTIS
jgi:intein/homing endonuclease